MRTNQPANVAGQSLWVVLVGLAFILLLLAIQPAPRPGPAGAEARFIGAKRCKSCHRSDATGNQFGVWTESRHSKAWNTLGSDAAKQYGAALDIDDPQQSERCLKCHVTAFGEPKSRFKGKHDPELGVQCESCHGPGSEHMSARFAAAAKLGAGEEPAPYTAVPEGEIITNPPMQTCLGCHNDESPGFKPFCFYERVAKIRHLNPKKPRSAEERAALFVCGCGEACGCVHGCKHDECGAAPESSGG